MGKRFNPNLAKIHYTYTIEEAAVLFGIHKNSVRAWIKQGLSVVDHKRPTLILGSELRGFLQSKRGKNKKHCQINEIYCVSCKVPQPLTDGLLEYEKINNTTNRIIAICPKCGSLINKYINATNFKLLQEQLDITIPLILKHLK